MGARGSFTFAGATAIVTGGGSGIGAALTRALVVAGADVVCADIDLAAADRVVAGVAGPGSARAAQVDVTDPIAVQRTVDEVIARSGRLDLMFNNAGILVAGEAHLQTLEQWNAIIDVNLRGVVHGVNAAYPAMVAAGRGKIVNTASAAGLMASGMLVSYCATKHAVVGLSLALRTEAAGYGVGVTVVCPSAVETPILDKGAFGSFRGRQFLLDAERSTAAYDADTLAAEVLAAVARDDAILVVPGRTRMGWRLSRLAPGLLNRMATKFVAEQRALG
jgi:NAD(P)-dependent dehydrogenase (short-subunit alcohol dehydrogenase family)